MVATVCKPAKEPKRIVAIFTKPCQCEENPSLEIVKKTDTSAEIAIRCNGCDHDWLVSENDHE